MEGGWPPPVSLLPSTWLSAGREGTAGLGGLCWAAGLWVPSCTHRPAPEADASAPNARSPLRGTLSRTGSGESVRMCGDILWALGTCAREQGWSLGQPEGSRGQGQVLTHRHPASLWQETPSSSGTSREARAPRVPEPRPAHHTDLPVRLQQVQATLQLLLHMGQGRAGGAQAPKVLCHPIT